MAMYQLFRPPWRRLKSLWHTDVVKPPTMAELQMIWPRTRLTQPPACHVPDGYFMRTYQSGDEAAFFELMERAGFSGWNMTEFESWLRRILPDGLYFVFHMSSGQMAATAMAVHNPTRLHPFGATLSCVAAAPAYQGQGLGRLVSAAVTQRLLQAGYKEIYMETDDWRLAAIKTYLKLGWAPFLFQADMPGRWKSVCEALGWPYTPNAWPITKLQA
jgi:mycothiol synthase